MLFGLPFLGFLIYELNHVLFDEMPQWSQVYLFNSWNGIWGWAMEMLKGSSLRLLVIDL
jgi:hypothetical protein